MCSVTPKGLTGLAQEHEGTQNVLGHTQGAAQEHEGTHNEQPPKLAFIGKCMVSLNELCRDTHMQPLRYKWSSTV